MSFTITTSRFAPGLRGYSIRGVHWMSAAAEF
ncbi:hypothetical protein BRAS3843_30033 [Bradyrhizobium sp. STM 3843]|nr:hypothetical protein BRAS3843_30033 [Bradyrhizobium sp. STM 3843]